MNIADFLHHLQNDREYRGQIVHVEHIPRREAQYGKLNEPLGNTLQDFLKGSRLFPLYTHQAEAINHVRKGSNVMVATSSSSGKTLCYNIPVLEDIINTKRDCALYLFPTKALAQDQLQGLQEMSDAGLLKPGEFATFDGDTPTWERAEIRKRARIILSNPDMLHVGILPRHRQWLRFLINLKFVVIDEAHVYRGVFGSHVACVLRRLRRICNLYGANPQFICCSATIANPDEHAESLLGLPFTVVDNDGSPLGGREFVFWNPPLLDEARSVRRSANSEATHLFCELVQKYIRSLTFTRTRRLTELIYSYSKRRLAETAPSLADKIRPYRAGYLPADRRNIEQGLFRGDLIGVVATNALELGIDIGDLEATVLNGYPGSIASTWQQAGRSGRSGTEALTFLIGQDGPLDQYFMRHPEALFGRSFENVLVNPDNPYILDDHLLCAAWEAPFTEADEKYFGLTFNRRVAELAGKGQIKERNHKWYLSPSVANPSHEVNIRAAGSQNFAIINTSTGSLLEQIEMERAFFQVHPGAIYLHQGDSYLVTGLDLIEHKAYVEPATVPYYTQARDLTDLRITKVIKSQELGEVKVYLGEVEVTGTVIGFKKKALYTEEVINEEPLDLPPRHFQTIALWFDLPSGAIDQLTEVGLDFAGGLHATEHAAIGVLPLFALCDRNDIGGVSTPLHPDTGKAQIFIYDGYPGGIGIAEKGFELIDELWHAALKVIAECPCEEGCPSCIQSPKCGNNNKPLDKKAAQMLLNGLLSRPVTATKTEQVIN